MNQPFLGDQRPAPILRDMNHQPQDGFDLKAAGFWFGLGVIVACIGFYLASH